MSHRAAAFNLLSALSPEESRDLLCDVIRTMAAPDGDLERHCLVLVNCLVLMFNDDARPMFLSLESK